jgi:hypothetical protein
MKRNPRPRKYASAADRQAAYRSRNEMLQFRAEPSTANKLNMISDTLDVSRSDLILSMVKFALTNHDYARFGLTHKTIPFYQGNPTMATKKPSAAQLAARKKFADMARSGGFARKKARANNKLTSAEPKTNRELNPISNNLIISVAADKSLGYYGSRGYIRKLLEDYAASGRVVSVRKKRGSDAIGVSFSGGKEMTLQNATKYLETLVNEGILKPSEVKPYRSNPKTGLYSNINAKRKRIAAGSGEKMRKAGEPSRPTAKAFIESAKTAKNPIAGEHYFNLGNNYFGNVKMTGNNEYYAQIFYRTTDPDGFTDEQIVPDYKPRYFVSAKSAVNSLMRYKTKSLKNNPIKQKIEYSGHKDFAGYAVREPNSDKYIAIFANRKQAIALAQNQADYHNKTLEVVRIQLVRTK